MDAEHAQKAPIKVGNAKLIKRDDVKVVSKQNVILNKLFRSRLHIRSMESDEGQTSDQSQHLGQEIQQIAKRKSKAIVSPHFPPFCDIEPAHKP